MYWQDLTVSDSRSSQVRVGCIDTDGALVVVLEEAQRGVVCSCQARNTGAGADKARPDIYHVRIAGFYVDWWESRERARLWLVVPRRRVVGTAAGGVAGEKEAAAARDGVGARLQLRLRRKQELERAVGIRPRGGNVKTEDGAHVVGRKDAEVLGPVGAVGLRLRDLRDVVRKLELAICQVAGAVGPWVNVAWCQRPLREQLAGVGGHETGKAGRSYQK